MVRVHQVVWEGPHHPHPNRDAGAAVWGRPLLGDHPEEEVQDQEVRPGASQQRREEAAQGAAGKAEEQAGPTRVHLRASRSVCECTPRTA